MGLSLGGCAPKDDFKLSIADFGFELRRDTAFPTNAPKTIAEMAPSDVILAVNGYPLTKQTYDDMMELRLKGIMEQKGMNNVVADKMMEEYKSRYIRNFQGQRMLVDEAFRLGVVSTNEVIAEIEKRLKADAAKRKMTVEKSLRKFGDKRKYLLQELFISITMDRFVTAKIPPMMKVDDRFVEATQKQIDADNAAAAKTNAMIRARMQAWRSQIMANRLDFITVAKRFSENPDEDGIWGEFEDGDLDDERISAKVFELRENAISDVLEDDNGYHLIKVLKVTPAQTNENGRIVAKEKRKLSHIYFEKLPEIIRMDDVKMTADLKLQMQMRAVNNYVTGLSTNGTTRIEFPNGQQLF